MSKESRRGIEETEELKKVISELKSKALEDSGESISAAEALASQNLTDESYVSYREEEVNSYSEEDGYSEEAVEINEAYIEPAEFEETVEEVVEEPVPVKREAPVKKRKSKKSRSDEDYIISLDHVSKSYVKGIPALDDVNLKIKRGEFVFIVGESGSGKSTLIRLLLRELKPTSGSIVVNGFQVEKLRQYQVPKLRRSMGVVFQDFRLLKDRDVYENVAFAQRIIQAPAREMKKNVPSMLAIVGLAGKYRAKPSELSGGEQQRVALARALVNKPPILLADEPTGNLDPRTTLEIMGLLDQINKNGTTVIVVTHNDKIVNDMQKRVVTIKNGIIVSDEKKGGYIDED